MTTLPALLLALSAPILAPAQAPAAPPAAPVASIPLRLWEGDAPGARGQAPHDIPTLTPYLPTANASGAGMVICPGGGYGMLAPHEGRDYALWLSQNGIAAFVLQYRLGSHGYRNPTMLQDAARAVRMVRSRAAEWKIDPNRLGIMGSSAGGHLASTLLTHFDAGDPIMLTRSSGSLRGPIWACCATRSSRWALRRTRVAATIYSDPILHPNWCASCRTSCRFRPRLRRASCGTRSRTRR